MSSITLSASSAITSNLRKLLPRPHTALVPADPRLASFRVALKSSREILNAGAIPNRIPETSETRNVKRRAALSIPMSLMRGTLFGPRI
jgi:hypothetical protein